MITENEKIEFSNWLKERGMAISSIRMYQTIANVFTNRVSNITTANISEFLDVVPKYYEGGVKRWLQFRGSNINWEEVLDRRTTRGKKYQIKPRNLSFEEIKILKDRLEFPYNKIVLLQFEFGARIREILNILCENLIGTTLEDGTPTIKVVLHTKGGKSRTVFTISEEAYSFLVEFVGKKGYLLPKELFINSDITNHDEDMIEERLIRSFYWKVWNKIKKCAFNNLGRDISTHWFRHARINYLYNELNSDAKTIQRFTGHSSLDMVDKYLTVAGKDTKELAEQEIKKRGGLKW